MATVNITVENDHDFYRVFQYQTISEVPINITGASFEMMLRRHARDEVALMRLGTDTGEIVITDAPNGKFSVRIPQLELERLATGTYEHSLIMTATTQKTGIWKGTFTNNPGATR